MENKRHTRKENRLCKYDYSSCGAYFITICTSNRENLFWSNQNVTDLTSCAIMRPHDVTLSSTGKIVDTGIKNITHIYPMVSVEEYVIMPDHVHFLLLIHQNPEEAKIQTPTISRVVQQFKGYVTKQIGKNIWQKLFYDHVIRSKEDYDEHLKYIYENPYKWFYEHRDSDTSNMP